MIEELEPLQFLKLFCDLRTISNLRAFSDSWILRFPRPLRPHSSCFPKPSFYREIAPEADLGPFIIFGELIPIPIHCGKKWINSHSWIENGSIPIPIHELKMNELIN